MAEPKGPDTTPKVNALIQEHGELVDLVIHEDSLVWQLRAGYLTVNATVLTITYFLGAFSTSPPPLRLIGPLISATVFYSVLSFLIFRRASFRLRFLLHRAYDIEDRLEGEFGVSLKTLSSTEKRISEGLALDERSGETRRLRRHERLDVLDMEPWSMLIGFAWVLYFLWLIAGRPFLT